MAKQKAAQSKTGLSDAIASLENLDDKSVSLLDVMQFAQVMAQTMDTFFGSLDKTLYREFREIGDYISQMREEIGRLQANDLKSERIPTAGEELDAVVRATEEATETIMSSAEAIMGADAGDAKAYQALVNEQMLAIIEACSFQDLTGQRINKVVGTLKHIEDRVSRFAEAIGEHDVNGPASEEEAKEEKRKKDLLLNGPQAKGEAIEQDAVDAMFD